MESTGTAKAEAESRAEAARIEGQGSVLQAKLKAEALAIETVSGGDAPGRVWPWGLEDAQSLQPLKTSGVPSTLMYSSIHILGGFPSPLPSISSLNTCLEDTDDYYTSLTCNKCSNIGQLCVRYCVCFTCVILFNA